MKKYIPSTAKIIKRDSLSDATSFDITYHTTVPIDKPSIIILGGGKTIHFQEANNYAERIERLMKENKLNKISIFSVIYTFNGRERALDRNKLFKKHISNIDNIKPGNEYSSNVFEQHPVPEYTRDLFETLILPRILDKFGDKISPDDIAKNLRKLIIFSHCHGASVVLNIEDQTYDKMLEVGYSKQEIDKVLKNLMVINFAPLTTIGKSKFTTLSFVSAADDKIFYHNNFNQYISLNPEAVKPCFFPNSRGNIFLESQLKTSKDCEHDTYGLLESEEIQRKMKSGEIEEYLTAQGKMFFSLIRSALVNSARNSVTGGPILTPKQLVNDGYLDYNEMLENGNELYSKMLLDLRESKQNQKLER